MKVFESFEHYAAALGHADLRVLALGKDRAPWEMLHTEVDDISVRSARDGAPCLFEGSIAADGIALLLGIDATGKICCNGKSFGPHSVLITPGYTPIQSSSLDAVNWMSVFVPSHRLRTQRVIETSSLPSTGRVIDVQTLEYIALRSILWRIIAATKSGAFVGNPIGQNDAAQRLAGVVDSIATGKVDLGCDRATGRPLRSRAEIIRGACAVVEAHAGRSLQVNELADTVGVSLRTLSNAFREQLGVSPRYFIRAYTLNAARRALRMGEPGGVKVSEVAARLGIWEWGRFARDYRQLFGELPSETLRRRHNA